MGSNDKFSSGDESLEEPEWDKSESGLSELSNENEYFEKKMHYQRRALLLKNLSLQSQAKCTNILQICVPLIGLFLLWLVGHVSERDIGSLFEKEIAVPVPFIFGLEYRPFSNLLGHEFLDVTNCDLWFMTDWASNATQETKDYWGYNPGTPWDNLQSGGMIDGKRNLLMAPCGEQEKLVPYFREWDEVNKDGKFKDVDAFLLSHLNNLSRTEFHYVNRYMDWNVDVIALPDAVYRVYEANDNLLHYDVRVNDAHLW